MSFMKMEDMPTLSQGQTLWKIFQQYKYENISGANKYLEHVLALGRLGPVLLLDGPELLQHLHLGLTEVRSHVLVPESIHG